MSNFTDEQIRELENLIAQGALEVEYGDRKVKLRSLKELLQSVRYMQGKKSGKRPKKTTIKASFDANL